MKNALPRMLTMALVVAVVVLGAMPMAAQDNTLTIASGTDIENTNIHAVTSSPSFSVLEHIHETLFSI